jgi:glycosyltransferase involved in cell wall biosynthesis
MKIKLSIVIVTLNVSKLLEETLINLISFNSNRIKIYIFDGASKDATLEVIHRYKESIEYWVSEPDKGIFDAMNKAFPVISSQAYISWINAGDKLVSVNEVFEIIDRQHPEIILCPVRDRFHVDNSTRIILPRISDCGFSNANYFKNHVHHQGFIIKNSSVKSQYQLKYENLADYIFMWSHIDIITDNYAICKNEVFSEFITGGVSYKPSFRRLKLQLECIKYFHLSPVLIFCKSPYRFSRMVFRQLMPYFFIILYRKFFESRGCSNE